MSNLIDRQQAIEKILGQPPELHYPSWYAEQIRELPPAEPKPYGITDGLDAISRQQAIDALDKRFESFIKRFGYDSYERANEKTKLVCDGLSEAEDVIMGLPSAQLATDTNVGTKLGTNLAEVGTDCISRQAAIDALAKALNPHLVTFVRAKNAIEQLPSVNNSEIPNSSDAISRQAAIDICTSAIDIWSGQLGEGALVAVRDKIAELPSAQPEIVQCKDCCYYNSEEKECLDLAGHGRRWEEDDFCSYGERREVMG